MDSLSLLLMSDAEVVQLVEGNPTAINDHNMFGDTILASCAQRQQPAALMAWLIDEKGANVHGRTRAGLTPLHKAASREGVSFLLARGLDATALDNYGWTPLMALAKGGQPEGIEHLLEESEVVEAIDKQATGHSSNGATALHLACSGHELTTAWVRHQVLELLLRADANPIILNGYRQTSLDTLRGSHPDNHDGIALFEQTVAETQRNLVLAKARQINDTNRALAKVKTETRRKILASTPISLKERVRKEQHRQQQVEQLMTTMPRAEVHSPVFLDEQAEKLHAALQYVLRAEALGETGGMSADVFKDLMDMMAPRWDPLRRRD
jgi:hypothetical protein